MRLLITARFDDSQLARLRPQPTEVRYGGWGVTRTKLTAEELRRELADIDIFIFEYEEITQEVLETAPRLRVLACCRNEPAASVDIAAATARGLPVLYPPGRNAISVAEYTFGLMIGIARHIPRAHHLLRYTDELTQAAATAPPGSLSPTQRRMVSEWSLDPSAPYARFQGPELAGKTLGLAGCGAIGREIARRALAFDMRVLVYDPYLSAEALAGLGTQKVELVELAGRADFVVMAAKVTAETRGLFSAAHFAAMKPTAYFINTARAALVDYDALYRALSDDRIAGAAIDVYEKEPLPADHPLRTLNNIILSPHLAGASRDIPTHHSRMIVDDLLLLLAGERPTCLLNPEVWKKA
ncbi:MAG: hypothetical protein J5I90_10055 [Caldilineales bacterium]|nr:hypothetical protein [Caldilineales bacterium]